MLFFLWLRKKHYSELTITLKKPKKRKGRHAKNPNKSFNRKISIGQGHP